MGSFSVFLPFFLSNLLFSLSTFYPVYPMYSLLSLFPLQHLFHSLWGTAHTIKAFVGKLSPSEGCSEPDQPPPEPQLASGTKYIERE